MSGIAVWWCACGETACSTPRERHDCCERNGVPKGWIRVGAPDDDFRPESYPLTLTWRSPANGETLHTLTVNASDRHVTVPAPESWPEPVTVAIADRHGRTLELYNARGELVHGSPLGEVEP